MTAVYSLIKKGKIPAVPVKAPIKQEVESDKLEKRILKLLLLKVALMNKISRFAYRDGCHSGHTYKSARVSNLLSPMQKKYWMIAYKQDSYKILEPTLVVYLYPHTVI